MSPVTVGNCANCGTHSDGLVRGRCFDCWRNVIRGPRDSATSRALPDKSTVGASTPATDAAADVPHETPDIQP